MVHHPVHYSQAEREASRRADMRATTQNVVRGRRGKAKTKSKEIRTLHTQSKREALPESAIACGGQIEQMVAPASANVSCGQRRHPASSPCPRKGDAVPAGQARHTSEVFAPTAVEKVPASHDKHVLAAIMGPYNPAPHAKHVCAAVSLEKKPGVHSWHTVRPNIGPLVPGVHSKHEVAPILLEKVPRGHAKHVSTVSAPSTSENFPGSQAWHWRAFCSDFPIWYVPGGQSDVRMYARARERVREYTSVLSLCAQGHMQVQARRCTNAKVATHEMGRTHARSGIVNRNEGE